MKSWLNNYENNKYPSSLKRNKHMHTYYIIRIKCIQNFQIKYREKMGKPYNHVNLYLGKLMASSYVKKYPFFSSNFLSSLTHKIILRRKHGRRIAVSLKQPMNHIISLLTYLFVCVMWKQIVKRNPGACSSHQSVICADSN